ncbi:hypothetical protein [Actinomycetospora termitidis]|uniref:Uncharacterized protein n=1 Tax=Actinomycetospora termitidis TaxID=3053470 RepID=A0ABT7MGD4_9PSEU|nr:hypothetical protein [Actinomycetospora sp. Odt1-22]MDL5159224.1 hypothetical protein [Actinomycetospora sp. Odt1-22]
MRLTRIAAATLIAGSLTFAGTGIALADTTTPVTASSSSVAAAELGVLTLGASSVKPGQSVSFSGTFAEPAASTATGPITVTSPAFAGAATMDRTNPEAFSGSATVASGATAGTYTVTASSSAGTVSTKLTVVGSGPAPTPAHHGGTGTGTHSSGTGSSSGESTGTTDSTSPDLLTTGSDALPWALGGLGAIALVGGGAYAIGRGRRADRQVEQEARQQYREPRTEVMYRR